MKLEVNRLPLLIISGKSYVWLRTPCNAGYSVSGSHIIFYQNMLPCIYYMTSIAYYKSLQHLFYSTLTYWGHEKIAILQMTFSIPFSWMKNVWISLKISLKFVPKVRINNIPALVEITAWIRTGTKPLSEPMIVNFLRHICITRPQLVKVMLWQTSCNGLIN